MTFAPLVVALCAVAAFATAFWLLRVPALLKNISEDAGTGISAMFDSGLDDDAKEKALQAAGLKLLRRAGETVLRFALVLAATALPIYGADLLGLVPASQTMDVLLRVDFIVIVSIVAIALVWLIRRLRPKQDQPEAASAGAYAAGDQVIHSLAFSGPGMLKATARFDDRLNRSRLAALPDRPPIFVTSLARGGTTALLNAMQGLPQIATHRYRDMPFVAAPLTWSKLTGRKRAVEKRQRAHGDGMEIDLDSAEAFDEIFWMLHWPEKYHKDGIEIWQAEDAKPEAAEFFRTHFRKINALRHPDVPDQSRYLSKNNANIARLRLLPGMFPGCDVIVPLRGPAAHAASLMRQHQNFEKLHAEEAFTLRYMRDIGHLEFGALHHRLMFPGVGETAHTPDQPDYWLAYWIAAFRDVRDHGGNVHIVTQSSLRNAPHDTVAALLDRLDIPHDRDFASFFRKGVDHEPEDMFSPALVKEAQEIYVDLATRAVG